VLRNRATGAIRLKQAEYSEGGLASVTGVSQGQLILSADNGGMYYAKTALFKENGGATRDDALFFDSTTGQLSKYDARWDGSRYTYWWAYTKNIPSLNAGWNGVRDDPWTVVMCKFSDSSALPQGATFWRNHFTAGTGGAGDYYWDMSYGSWDLYGTRVIGPYTLTESSTSSKAVTRQQRGQLCQDAATAAGANVPGSKVIFYLNVAGDDGNYGGYVVADPSLNSPTAIGHEMGHVYGLNDSADDRGEWYGDHFDVMSAMSVYCFSGPALLASPDTGCYSIASNDWASVSNTAAGPGLNSGNRIATGLLPSGRVRVLTPGGSRKTASLDIAVLDRPEAGASASGAVQAIRIPIASGPLPECVPGNTCSTSGNYYTVEVREPRGWDRTFTRSAVYVHKVGKTNEAEGGGTQTFLKTSPLTQFLAGTTYQDSAITVHVNSLDTIRGVANVTVTY
jgi:hypothetical protein